LTIKVSKTLADGKFMYINLHGFKDQEEQDKIFKQIQVLLKETTGRIRVF